jgi:hypothetical protein
MILHLGERVYWGAPEVIYLEGTIHKLDAESQAVIVHIDRTTPHSAHLIDTNIVFAANGVAPLIGDSPPGVTSERNINPHPQPLRRISDEEKVRSAASVAVHQQYGYTLPKDQEDALVAQVAQTLNSDPALRTRIIASMDEILQREF